ncbi:MAG: YfhO family protein [Erysipelotrichaceae bacterium]|nr:YfhO family protein [Erysipelotrichaceae bacterium]
MKNYKKHLIVLGILTLLTLIVFSPYLLDIKPFLFGADQQLQYSYFYEEWKRLLINFIETKTFPFYSFNTYLGNNFYASKLYYVTGDIFMPFIMLFKDVEIALMWVTLILVILSGFNFSLFLRTFGLKREKAIIVGSIIYAFSGIASIYIGQYMFHRFYCFLPLAFMGIENYLIKGKLTFFAISITILALQNYYFLFPTSLMMVLYYFFTNYYHGRPFKVLKILKSSIPLIIAYLIGILLAGILFVPGILYILQNERVGSSSFTLFYNIRVYLGFLFHYISAPITLFSRYGYLFYADTNGHLSWYSIYTGAITAPIIFSLINKEIKNHKDKAIKIFYLTVVICTLTPFISSIFHGFSGSSMRWMFLVTFINALIVSIYLENFEKKANEILKGSLNYLMVFIISFIFLFLFKIVDNHREHIIVLIVSFIIFCMYIYLIKTKKYKYVYICTVIEVCIMMPLCLVVLSSTSYKYNPTLDKETISYYNYIDDDIFYRMYVNPKELLPTSDMNLNQSIKMNFYTTTTYDSTMEPQLKKFNELNGFNWHIINVNDMEALRMLGVKYYIVSDESMLPKGYEWTYYNNINHLMMFKLENYRPIGFTYSKFKKDLNLEYNIEDTIVSHDLDWNNELLVEEDLYELVQDIEPSGSIDFELLEFYNDNHLYGHIKNDVKQVLYFSIPYTKGWRVYDNEIMVDTYKVQGGFIGILLEPGDHYITLQFSPPGFKYGAYSTIIGALGVIVLFVLDLKTKERSVEID